MLNLLEKRLNMDAAVTLNLDNVACLLVFDSCLETENRKSNSKLSQIYIFILYLHCYLFNQTCFCVEG
jgi:hypothetical protein